MSQILIVEDSKMFSDIIVGNLNNALELDISVAENYEEAMEFINDTENNYFLALVDLVLPDAPNGEIVDLVQSSGIPAVVVTGEFSDDMREYVLSKNVVDYVLKESVGNLNYLTGVVKRCYKNQFIKVLVVDDSRTSRTMIRQLLEKQKFKVIEAMDGDDALRKLKDYENIKMVITDYNMPNMDGFELTAEIRKKFSKEKLAVIGISAHGTGILSAKFIKKGANDFMVKPFISEEFYCRINQNIEMLEYIEMIQDASYRDYLTDLYNRRFFFEKGEKLFRRSKQENSNFSIAMIDIDHFKQINDTYGHETGDAALKQVAEIITGHFSHEQLVARFGGEEFCVITPDLSWKEITRIFEKIRKTIEDKTIKFGMKELKLTVSIGVTIAKGDSLDEMVNRADKILYKAKRLGRNRVIVE